MQTVLTCREVIPVSAFKDLKEMVIIVQVKDAIIALRSSN